MALAHFRMLIHEFFNKDQDIVTEEASQIILYSKSPVCMSKNVNYTKHTRPNARRIHFLMNGEKCKMHKIDWCEGGLILSDIATQNVVEHNLTPRIKYIMVILDN